MFYITFIDFRQAFSETVPLKNHIIVHHIYRCCQQNDSDLTAKVYSCFILIIPFQSMKKTTSFRGITLTNKIFKVTVIILSYQTGFV
jgi:hypothetical protein